MKNRANWLIIPAVAFGLGACNKKEEAKAPAAPAPAAEAPAVPVPAPAPKVPTVSPEERAAKLGFGKHLPQDAEVVLSFYNGTKTADRVKSSKLWKLVQKQMGGGMVDLDEEDVEPDVKKPDADANAADDEPMGPAMLLGTEFTIALGKSTGEQTANLLTLNRRMGYFQFRGIAKALVAAAKKGDASDIESALASGYNEELFTNLLKDSESGIQLLEKAKMPPMYFAFRTKDAQRPAAAQQLAAMLANLGMLGETVEPVEVEKAGRKFEGFKVSGAKISASMAEGRKDMEESMDAATVDQLLAVVAKKDIVLLSGTVGDYALLFIGRGGRKERRIVAVADPARAGIDDHRVGAPRQIAGPQCFRRVAGQHAFPVIILQPHRQAGIIIHADMAGGIGIDEIGAADRLHLHPAGLARGADAPHARVP